MCLTPESPACLQYFRLLLNYFAFVNFDYYVSNVNKINTNYLHSLASHVNILYKIRFLKDFQCFYCGYITCIKISGF